MSILQGSTLLSSTACRPSQRRSSVSGAPASAGHSVVSRSPLPALTSLIQTSKGTLDHWKHGWDGLTVEERAERMRVQARRQVLYLQLRDATTYDEWRNAAVELDEVEGNNEWKQEADSLDYDPEEIRVRLEQLDAARISCDVRRMLFLIRTSLTRNLGNMGNIRLYSRSFVGTKDLIEQYINSALATLNSLQEISEYGHMNGLTNKAMLDQVIAARQAFGRSALLLSGGANFGMNHIGVLKALWEAKLLPRIISGASAGSIVCSVLCTHTDEEIPEVLESFTRGNLNVFEEEGDDGWVISKLTRFLKYGSLFDVALLTRVVREMLGDITFQEAYNRTRRILNICVSSASLYELPRLLNYVTAPNVLIWSAVAASCSVPLLFTSGSLLAKDPLTGEHVPWNASPQKWIDGSVDNDLPMTRLAEMFNVNHFIVSQVNPHVVPFIAKEEEAALRHESGARSNQGPSADAPSWLHTVTALAKSEAIHRMHTLIDLGVFPNTLTKTVSVLSQKYSGDITILPEISYADFPTMMSNPTVEFIEKSMLRGERATWPKFSRIRNHVAIELALDDAVQRLRTRVVFSASQADLRLNAYPKARSDARTSLRAGGPRTSRNYQHRRTSNSSEVDAAAAYFLKHGRMRLSIDATHSKARSVHLPWNGPGIVVPPGQSAATHPTPLSDVLSSGCETSNPYTSDSLADQSSSESTTSPSSPIDEPGWDESRGSWSYSVPSTPTASRRPGSSYLTLTPGPVHAGTKPGNSAASIAPQSKSNTLSVPTVQVSGVPRPQSPQETRYKKLFHPKGTASRQNEGRRRITNANSKADDATTKSNKTTRAAPKSNKTSSPPPEDAANDSDPTRSRTGVRRFNKLGLEIDLSGAKGMMRKKNNNNGGSGGSSRERSRAKS